MKRILATLLGLGLIGCVQAQSDNPFDVEVITDFHEPWALAFLPDGRMLITEKKGVLYVVDDSGRKFPVRGTPDVDYGGQGGFGDVAIHPDFEENGLVYLSYAEAGVGNTRGAAVARAVLQEINGRDTLTDLEVIWRQYPKVLGSRALRTSHRIR